MWTRAYHYTPIFKARRHLSTRGSLLHSEHFHVRENREDREGD